MSVDLDIIQSSFLSYRGDGKLLASGSDQTIQLWDVATGDWLLTCNPPTTWGWTLLARQD